MKPLNLLRTDLYIQYGLAAINLCALLATAISRESFVALMVVQVTINVYHFCTNLIHINAKHRSLGFARYRDTYFDLTMIYVPIFMVLSFMLWWLPGFMLIVWLIIPQIVLHLYIYLCKKEVDFIEQNEFHILK